MQILSLWIQLGITTAIILYASNFLAQSADNIAEKTGLGRSVIGVVLLATATSLPELGTGASSIVLFNEIDLAAGDVYGSCVFNLLIIAILDLIYRNKPILSTVGNTPIIVAGLSLVLISVSVFGIIYTEYFNQISFLLFNRLDPISIVLLLLFIISMFVIYRIEKNNHASEVAINPSYTLKKSAFTFLLSAIIIIICAVWLANVGKNIAILMEWETSFVGTQFLAFSTSLPELAASIAALRINAPELAITNVLGSNLFNIGVVLFADDLVANNIHLLSVISNVHLISAIASIIMTIIVLFSCKQQFSNKIYGDITAIMIMTIYITSSISIYQEGFQLLYFVFAVIITLIIAIPMRFYFNFTNTQLN
ncbi:MAG: sodium:calcium antiporter [Dehalococcoidia bacterium]